MYIFPKEVFKDLLVLKFFNVLSNFGLQQKLYNKKKKHTEKGHLENPGLLLGIYETKFQSNLMRTGERKIGVELLQISVLKSF